MGQTQSLTEYTFPRGSSFTLSMCKTTSFKKKKQSQSEVNIEIKEKPNTYLELMYIPLYHKVFNLGYDIPYCIRDLKFKENNSILYNLKRIIKHGFTTHDQNEKLNDLKCTPVSYKQSIQTIKRLISEGNILISGLILDSSIVQFLTKENRTIEEVFDIILITGYSEDYLRILTTWSPKQINLPIEFLDNFKEIWNVEIINSIHIK